LPITVGDVNEAPASLALSNDALPENSPAGAVVGNLLAADPDAGDTISFALVENPGDRFTIDGSKLIVAGNAVLDYETTPDLV
jgi:hypothetical protein